MTNGNIQTAYCKNPLLLEKDLSEIAIKSIVFKKGGTVKKETRELDRKKYLITHYSWLPEYISDWDTWMADIPDSIVSRQQILPSDLSPIERSLVASIDAELLSIDVHFDPVVTNFIEWLRTNRI